MPNRDENNPDLGKRDGNDRSESGKSGGQDNNEWLRDQTGEDHNLSGSSTYRTLPDQPEGESNDAENDTEQRQSKR
jgi:hypothetical protein